MALSKTNTDALCLDTSQKGFLAFVRKCIYRYNLWTGLYMLERHERYAFHAVVGTFLVAVLVYCGVFTAGIVQGMTKSA